jgi:hypothetical protein
VRYLTIAALSDRADSDADLSVFLLAPHETVCLLTRYRDPSKPSGDAMPVVRLPSKTLKGLSFSVPELILIKSWSEGAGLRMVVRLDHGSETEDYEEVLALHVGGSKLCRWIMWRGVQLVFVQPLIGRLRGYGSVAEAFEYLAARRHTVLTDIKPGRWPL